MIDSVSAHVRWIHAEMTRPEAEELLGRGMCMQMVEDVERNLRSVMQNVGECEKRTIQVLLWAKKD